MEDMPILRAMERYAARNVHPLHTPGHKGGRVIKEELRTLLGESALRIDVSLMGEELGNLHTPSGCIAEAESLAAELYGADRTFFAVNGSSGAIQAMLLGAFTPGDKVLMGRNIHCSVFAGVLLADLQPIFLDNEYVQEFAIHAQITVAQVEAVLQAEPDIKGIFITSPSYYGMVADVAGISKLAEQYKIPLLVDEAHGAHLYFSELLPMGALQLGASAVVQSTHKTLSSLSQTALLHIKHGGSLGERIKSMQNMLTTTSPNNLLLASLDAACCLMREQGRELWNGAYATAVEFRRMLSDIEGMKVCSVESLRSYKSVVGLDVTKVIVNVRGYGYTGMEVADYLCQRGFSAELADRDNVLFLLTYADAIEDLQVLVEVLRKLPRRAPLPLVELTRYHAQGTGSVAKAYRAERETIPLHKAVGRVVAETVTFYPPGIPSLLPGDLLTAEGVEYCQRMLSLGVTVNGCKDASLQFIEVVKE